MNYAKKGPKDVNVTMVEEPLSPSKFDATLDSSGAGAVKNFLMNSNEKEKQNFAASKINYSGGIENTPAYQMYASSKTDSPPQNAKIAKILKQSREEDPTKLTFLDVKHDDTYAVESSESGSFYYRQE